MLKKHRGKARNIQRASSRIDSTATVVTRIPSTHKRKTTLCVECVWGISQVDVWTVYLKGAERDILQAIRTANSQPQFEEAMALIEIGHGY